MLGIKIYCMANAILYALFSALSFFRPERTAAYLGQAFSSPDGKIEFMTVYGGMELGFAAFYLLGFFHPNDQVPALHFSLCLYASLMAFRIASLIMVGGASGNIYGIFALEALLFFSAAALAYLAASRSSPSVLQ